MKTTKLIMAIAMLFGAVTFADSVSCDNFANARHLSGTSGLTTFDNTGYTKESGEPTHSSDGYPGGASAWASWTAPSTGDWTFWLEGTSANYSSSELDTQLAIYTGNAVGSLEKVGANDDTPAGGYSSRLSIHVTKGVEYKIAMDSYTGIAGSMTLRWEEVFINYVLFEYDPMFVSASGGEAKIHILSSTKWNVVGCSDWIVPSTMSGTNGVELAFSYAPNTTGGERTGYLTIQAGNSDPISLSVRQHMVDFVTTKEEAFEAAWRTNKRILLLYGREGCGNTRATLFSSIPSTSVRPIVENGYVLWYSNCDRQTDAYVYRSGLSSITLPLVCIIDARDMSTYIARTTGYQSESALKLFLESNSSWSGLAAPTEVKMSGADMVLGEAAYSMNVTFADGTAVDMKHGVEWSVVSGSAATISKAGVLTPVAGRTGTVTVRGSVVVRGQTYTRTKDVRVVIMSINDMLNNSTLSFETGGDAPWFGTLSDSHDGTAAARSGQISNSQSSWLQSTVVGTGTLSFWWNVSSESPSYDYLKFSIDGIEQARIGGTNETWSSRSFSIEAGSHVVRWEYTKDSSVSRGSDCGWVDQITWVPNGAAAEYTLTLNPNGGSYKGSKAAYVLPNATQTAKLTYGKAYYWRVGAATRTGYIFKGWYDAKSGGKKVYDAKGEAVKGDYWSAPGSAATWKHYGNITVYAQWAKAYTVRFYPNGSGSTLSGSIFGASDGQSKTATVTFGLKTDLNNTVGVAKRTGYVFLGWYTQRDAGGLVFDAKGKCRKGGAFWNSNGCWIKESNVSLYAHWAKAYTVRFYPNGSGSTLSGSIFGASDGQSKTATVTFGLKSDINNTVGVAKRSGYVFAGWCTQRDAGGLVFDANGKCRKGGAFWNSKGCWIKESNVSLYAHWTKVSALAPISETFSVSSPTRYESETVDGIAYLPDGESFPVEVRIDADGFAVVELEDAIFCGYVVDGVGELFSGDRTLYLTLSP